MSIAELESKVRDRINRGRKQHELLGRSADWNKLCSALDIVGDTELALDSYLNQPRIGDPGLCYLHVYGALQLLQTQQDAVAHICSALGIKAQSSPKLPHIREIRSSSVAHPAAVKEDKATRSNFIVRSSIGQYGFTLMTVYSNGTPYSQRSISIPKLVAEQRGALRGVLEEVLAKMDEAEMKHRSEHRDEKLQDAFPDTLSYYFSKIFEAIHNSTYFPLGEMHVELVAECLVRLKQLLEERGEWGIYDSVNYEYELLEYPLGELKVFFANRASSKFNEKDAYIFCAFVREQLKALQQIAREIDDEYAKDPADEG
jgi:hypothetical protein